MTTAIIETPALEQEPSIGDRVIDACRRAAHNAHTARLVKSMAKDALEDRVYAARRALKSVRRCADGMRDLRDDAIHQMKRQPLRTVRIVFSAGLVTGMAVSWVACRLITARMTSVRASRPC